LNSKTYFFKNFMESWRKNSTLLSSWISPCYFLHTND